MESSSSLGQTSENDGPELARSCGVHGETDVCVDFCSQVRERRRGWSLSGFHGFHRVQKYGFHSDEIGGQVRAMERATGRRGYSEEIPRGVSPLDQRGEGSGRW